VALATDSPAAGEAEHAPATTVGSNLETPAIESLPVQVKHNQFATDLRSPAKASVAGRRNLPLVRRSSPAQSSLAVVSASVVNVSVAETKSGNVASVPLFIDEKQAFAAWMNYPNDGTLSDDAIDAGDRPTAIEASSLSAAFPTFDPRTADEFFDEF
jgi:hypothetical protein